MPHQTEPSANNALGGLLQGMLSRRQVLSENTQTIAGASGVASGHPDYGGRLLAGGGRGGVHAGRSRGGRGEVAAWAGRRSTAG